MRHPQTGEVDELVLAVRKGHPQPTHLPVGNLFEAPPEAELVHDGERRGMHGVAAEVAQEVGVLFEHHHAPSLPCEEEAEEEPRRPTADNADVGVGHGAPFQGSDP